MSMQPGWYPDPFSSGGYVRWWDGQRWGQSTAVAEGAATTTDPGSPVPLPPPMTAPLQPAPGAYQPGGYQPGASAAPLDTTGAPVALSNWGSRAAAKIIDWLIESVIAAPFVALLLRDSFMRFFDAIQALPADATQVPPSIITQFTNDITDHVLTITVVTVVVGFLYTVPQDAIWNRTLGKRMLGIRIRPKDVDGRLGWPRATVRWLVWIGLSLPLGGVLLLVDILFPLWDKPWRQAIHDKAAGTVVARLR
jgi:uncharacterized RDD family membrane protein YckC